MFRSDKVSKPLVACDIKRLKAIFKLLRVQVKVTPDPEWGIKVVALSHHTNVVRVVGGLLESQRNQTGSSYINVHTDMAQANERDRKVAARKAKKRQEICTKFGPIGEAAYLAACKNPGETLKIKGTPYFFLCQAKTPTQAELLDEAGGNFGTAYTLEGAKNVVTTRMIYRACASE